jgi:tetratricopeptide (TPR) repeat protein
MANLSWNTSGASANGAPRLRVCCARGRSRLAVRATCFALVTLIGVGGCRLFGNRGPVPEEVATCRQLAQRGMSALERGEWNRAESLLSQAIKSYPDDPNAQRYYAEVLWQRGLQEDALRHAEEAQRLASDDAGIAVRLGEMQLTLGRLDEARRIANEAIDLDPHSAAGWALRGRVAVIDGQLDAALADFHRALAAHPGDRELIFETAEVYRRMNRPQRALATLASARENYQSGDEPARLLYMEGLALAALDRHQDAIDAYQEASKRAAPTAELFAQLAQSHLRAGQVAEAEQSVAMALSLDPRHAASIALAQRFHAQRMAQAPR